MQGEDFFLEDTQAHNNSLSSLRSFTSRMQRVVIRAVAELLPESSGDPLKKDAVGNGKGGQIGEEVSSSLRV